MKKLVLGCALITALSSSAFAWEVPSAVNDLIIGPYVAQNDVSFKEVSVKAGEECLVYSDGTAVEILEEQGEQVLVKLNASLVFKTNFADDLGKKKQINLYKDYSARDNDLCPRGTLVLFDKTELRELHDIKSLHVEDYFQADQADRIAAEQKSIGIPEQVRGLNLGYFEASNSTRNYKNFVNEGEVCAILGKGSDLLVSATKKDSMMSVLYHPDSVFMYDDPTSGARNVNLYSVIKRHNTDLCPDGTLLTIPLAQLAEWEETKMARISWDVDRDILVASSSLDAGPELSR